MNNFILNILYYLGFTRMLQAINEDCVTILAYHRVCPSSENNFLLKDMSVSPEDFDEQMYYLSRNYRIISLNDFVLMTEKEKWKKKCVVITFDDAYLDNYEYALPVLRKYNIPATIFVPTYFVESKQCLFWDEVSEAISASTEDRAVFEFQENVFEYDLSSPSSKVEAYSSIVNLLKKLRLEEVCTFVHSLKNALKVVDSKHESLLMTWDNMIDMKKYDVEFGAHTHSHCAIASCNDVDQFEEIARSRAILDEKLSQTTTSFAYPFGGKKDIGETAPSNVENAGLTCALTMEQGLVSKGDDLYLLKRIGVGGNDDMKRFIMKISGLIPYLSRFKERFR